VDKEIEDYPFVYFLATLNGNGRNPYCEREEYTYRENIPILRWGLEHIFGGGVCCLHTDNAAYRWKCENG